MPDIRVLSYNIFFLWCRSNPMLRAEYIPGALGGDDDVLVFLEAFADQPRERLLHELAKLGYTHATPVLHARPTHCLSRGALARWHRPWSFPLLNGGILIVSKWPITRHVGRIFGHRQGVELVVPKGMMYARIDRDGFPVHVFAAHAQADDSLMGLGKMMRHVLPVTYHRRHFDSMLARKRQCEELRSWIDDLNIPASEPVIIAGDFNVDVLSPEYPPMMELLEAVLPPGDQSFSIDLEANHFCNLGKHPEIVRWLGGRAPSVSAKSEFVDYVLYSRRHLQPFEARLDTVKPRTPPVTGSAEGFDLSDHYAVRGLLRY